MAGLFPEALVEDLRAAHFLVAVVAIDGAHVLLDFLPDRPALGVPEHQPGGFVLHVEQVEMLAEAAMVAFFSFLEHVQIGVEVLLLGPGSAVDALQLLVAVVAAPVGAGHLHQFEDLELARGRHVRAAAEVDEITFAVERNLLVGGNRGDQFGLVLFARIEEELYGGVARPDFAADRDILLRQLTHALFDRHQVFRRERALVGEIIVKAILDDRPDRDLGLGEQFLDRIGQQVGGRVANDFEAVRIALGDDGEISVLLDQVGGVDHLAIDFAGQCGAGQAGADAGGDFGNGDRLLVAADGTIRQFDIGHGGSLGKKKVRGEPHFSGRTKADSIRVSER